MGLVIGTGGLHIGTSGGGASPVKRFDAEAEYIKRKAGGTDNIGTGKAKITALKGKSLVWNQLIENGDFSNGFTGWQSNGTPSISNGVLTITGSDTNQLTYNPFDRIVGHKYVGFADVMPVSNTVNLHYRFINDIIISPASPGVWQTISQIGVINSEAASKRYTIFCGTVGVTWSCKNLRFFDLTLLFGPGHEPSTVAEFEAMYPLPYYDYNPGKIVNNEAEAIETVGFNQWDEEWRNGYYDEGGFTATARCLCSKNMIPVFPSTVYGLKKPVGATSIYICEYDAGGNFIRAYWRGASATTLTTGDSTHFIHFNTLASEQITTYNHDICINLSDTARNGQYEPYEKHTLQLGLDAFDVKDSEDNVITVNGLKSAGSAFDEIDLARGKYIKRIGSVDLGSLEWTYNSTADHQRFYATLSAKSVAPSVVANIINAKYLAATFNAVYGHTQDKIIALTNNGLVAIYDSSYTDAATFTTAMVGITLYYELDEPIEYDLVTPIGNSYKVISGGTEERLPRDTASSVMAPIKYSVKYVQPKD